MRSGATDYEVVASEEQGCTWSQDEANVRAETWAGNRARRDHRDHANEEWLKAVRGLAYDEKTKPPSKAKVVSSGSSKKRQFNEIGDAYRNDERAE